MINKIITLFKIARKLGQSDAMKIISKLHEPPKIIKFFFYLFSFSFSNPKKENNNLNEEQKNSAENRIEKENKKLLR